MAMNYRLLGTFAIISLVLLTACREEAAKKKPTPIVTVAVPKVEPVADYEDFTGRTDAVSTVKIRARVSGYLIKVGFKDGDMVKEGHLLYQIDPRPFQADLDQAKGVVGELEAAEDAVGDPSRAVSQAARKGAASQQDLDEYLGQQAENVGGAEDGPGPGRACRAEPGFHADYRPDRGQDRPHPADRRQSGQRRHDAS